jgi:hypothetical protein
MRSPAADSPPWLDPDDHLVEPGTRPCADIATLERWHIRAIEVRDAAELLA